MHGKKSHSFTHTLYNSSRAKKLHKSRLQWLYLVATARLLFLTDREIIRAETSYILQKKPQSVYFPLAVTAFLGIDNYIAP